MPVLPCALQPSSELVRGGQRTLHARRGGLSSGESGRARSRCALLANRPTSPRSRNGALVARPLGGGHRGVVPGGLALQESRWKPHLCRRRISRSRETPPIVGVFPVLRSQRCARRSTDT